MIIIYLNFQSFSFIGLKRDEITSFGYQLIILLLLFFIIFSYFFIVFSQSLEREIYRTTNSPYLENPYDTTKRETLFEARAIYYKDKSINVKNSFIDDLIQEFEIDSFMVLLKFTLIKYLLNEFLQLYDTVIRLDKEAEIASDSWIYELSSKLSGGGNEVHRRLVMEHRAFQLIENILEKNEFLTLARETRTSNFIIWDGIIFLHTAEDEFFPFIGVEFKSMDLTERRHKLAQSRSMLIRGLKKSKIKVGILIFPGKHYSIFKGKEIEILEFGIDNEAEMLHEWIDNKFSQWLEKSRN